MVLLILSRLAFGVKKIGNGRAAREDRFAEDVLQYSTEELRLLIVQICAAARGMNPGPPQALIGVNISYAAQYALVQEQCFDVGVARADARGKFFYAY